MLGGHSHSPSERVCPAVIDINKNVWSNTEVSMSQEKNGSPEKGEKRQAGTEKCVHLE